MRQLILASTSRYRRELLGRLKLEFSTHAPAADEGAEADEAPSDLATRLATAKALSVPDFGAVVIGSDQVASLDGVRLRKPGTQPVAVRQLLDCQGKVVLFHTAVTVLDQRSGAAWSYVDCTEVHFAALGRESIERYVAIEQPYDCAGSFKAEGLGIALFDRIVSTDPTALLGLPLIWLARMLSRLGLDPLGAPRER